MGTRVNSSLISPRFGGFLPSRGLRGSAAERRRGLESLELSTQSSPHRLLAQGQGPC